MISSDKVGAPCNRTLRQHRWYRMSRPEGRYASGTTERRRHVTTETKSRGAERLLYSPEEVAQALGVGPTFARGLIREGELRDIRIGRLLKVPVTEVEAYIEGSCWMILPCGWPRSWRSATQTPTATLSRPARPSPTNCIATAPAGGRSGSTWRHSSKGALHDLDHCFRAESHSQSRAGA
jgi:excisionase family DNA binding protein